MTSKIEFSGIDGSYPIAGKDNDSQGFRDNFTLIKAGLGAANQEITTLQSNSVLSADLVTNGPVTNNLNGSTIDNGFYNRFYGNAFVSTVTSSPGQTLVNQDIDLSKGSLHVYRLTCNTAFRFINWPNTGKYASVRIHLWSATSPNISLTNASSSGSTITVTSTAGLTSGLNLTVTSGTGAFVPGTTIADQPALTSTTFPVTQNPSTPLSNATITASGSWTASFFSENGGTINFNNQFPNPCKIDSSQNHFVLEAWTWTGSDDRKIYIRQLGNFTATLPSVNPVTTFTSYTTTQRNAIPAVVGMVIFNTTTGKLEVCSRVTPSVQWDPMN